MVRRRSCAVSNHEEERVILRDAAKRPLLRMRFVVSNEPACQTFYRSRRAFRAPRRHWVDAVVDIHVLVWRCAGKVHGRHLFSRTIAVAARLCGADRATTDGLATSRRVHAARTAM